MQTNLNKIFRWLFPHKNASEIMQKYHIPEKINLQIELTPDGWFCASSPDLPGLVTQARSQQELVEMVNDAVLTYFDVPRREADIIFDKIIVGTQVIRYKGEVHARIA